MFDFSSFSTFSHKPGGTLVKTQIKCKEDSSSGEDERSSGEQKLKCLKDSEMFSYSTNSGMGKRGRPKRQDGLPAYPYFSWQYDGCKEPALEGRYYKKYDELDPQSSVKSDFSDLLIEQG
jgi:hypothetical protein